MTRSSFSRLYFFGRFNFPHVGYRYVIREALTQMYPTDGITIVFSKEQATWGKTAIPLHHRQAMFSLLIQDFPPSLRDQVAYSDMEYQLSERLGTQYQGYTIDTLRELVRASKEGVGLVLGADAALGIPGIHPGFSAWKQYTDLLKLATLIIVPRGRYPTKKSVQDQLPKELLTSPPIILSTHPTLEELHASSTRIQEGAVAYLPSQVLSYATKHRLLVQ